MSKYFMNLNANENADGRNELNQGRIEFAATQTKSASAD
jgi:hypothetical protein